MPAPPLGVDRLPPRVWIVGPTGSGKSTLADTLAARLGVEATHLDDLHWEPGWVERPHSDLVQRLEPVIARPSFVVDGNYTKAQTRFLDRVDLFVWLDFPLATTFRRLVGRTLVRSLEGTECCNGNRERLGNALFGHDSILAWSLSRHVAVRRRYTGRLAARPHLRFRDPRRLANWLAAVAPR
jgi:adenylate kinase family enzyme